LGRFGAELVSAPERDRRQRDFGDFSAGQFPSSRADFDAYPMRCCSGPCGENGAWDFGFRIEFRRYGKVYSSPPQL
jgi:hypothetical protein